MKLDRSMFLGLVSTLAAVACAAPSAEDAGQASGASSDNGSPALACLEPGSAQTKVPDTFVDQCTTLARTSGEHFQSVYGQCMAYASRFKSKTAATAMTCIKNEVRPGEGFWTSLYGCGASTLASSCTPATGSNVGPRCASILSALKQGPGRAWLATADGKTDDASLDAECRAFLSGSNPDAADELESCAKKNNFPLYSCLEGMDARPVATCTDPTPVVNVSRVANDICAQVGQASAPGQNLENAQSCHALADAFRSVPANSFLDSLNARLETSPNAITSADVSEAAVWAARQVCQTDKAIETCKGLVGVLTERGASNAGGRLTKECRQVMSALDADATDKAVSYIKRTPDFGKGRSLYKVLDVFYK